MISLKTSIVVAAAMFAAGSFLAQPVQQAIAAVIATDVQCTGCVGSADLAGNAVTAAKIKDGEVKAAEIATDAVGAAEIQGVTKLLFAQCVPTSEEASTLIGPTFTLFLDCSINGVDNDDTAIASTSEGSHCFTLHNVDTGSGVVTLELTNHCNFNNNWGSTEPIGIVVFDK